MLRGPLGKVLYAAAAVPSSNGNVGAEEDLLLAVLGGLGSDSGLSLVVLRVGVERLETCPQQASTYSLPFALGSVTGICFVGGGARAGDDMLTLLIAGEMSILSLHLSRSALGRGAIQAEPVSVTSLAFLLPPGTVEAGAVLGRLATLGDDDDTIYLLLPHSGELRA